MRSNKYTQAERFDRITLHSDAAKPGQVPCYFRFLKGIIDISCSRHAIILYGPKWGHNQNSAQLWVFEIPANISEHPQI